MGPNLETSDDSAGNGLANILVVLEHMDDSERTERHQSARVSVANLRKTPAVELDYWGGD